MLKYKVGDRVKVKRHYKATPKIGVVTEIFEGRKWPYQVRFDETGDRDVCCSYEESDNTQIDMIVGYASDESTTPQEEIMASQKTYKIQRRYYDEILAGTKTFEVRKIDSELLSAKQLRLVQDPKMGKEIMSLVCDIGFIFPLGEAEQLFDDDGFGGVAQYAVISLLNVKEVNR